MFQVSVLYFFLTASYFDSLHSYNHNFLLFSKLSTNVLFYYGNKTKHLYFLLKYVLEPVLSYFLTEREHFATSVYQLSDFQSDVMKQGFRFLASAI